MKLKVADPRDAQQVLSIYEPYVKETSLTFEIDIPSVEEFAERIIQYTKEWPWLVATMNGQIAGYAYASKYRERKGYQWCVECSVYVSSDHMRKGVGEKLYRTLFELLRLQGYRNVYAVINLPNERSVLFHERLGFKWFATYEKVGYKLGRWKDVGWWQLIINEYNDEPSAPVPFAQLDPVLVTEILNKQTH